MKRTEFAEMHAQERLLSSVQNGGEGGRRPGEEAFFARTIEAPDINPENSSSGPLPNQTLLSTELLILPDGTVLVHNLTPLFAKLLAELNPGCEQIASRVNDVTGVPRLHNEAKVPVEGLKLTGGTPRNHAETHIA